MDVASERAYPTPFVNSTLLPMLLLSLAQQKHSPETARSVKTEYDYVIVGAGSAGSVVASRLSEMPCVSVLLLEAGKPPPMLTDVPSLSRFFWFTDIDWQYRTAPQRYTGESLTDRQVVWPSGKTLGGSSVLNSNVAVRGNRKDYDRWAEEGADGWSYEDVLPYFKKMEDNRDPEYLVNGFHGTRGPITLHRPRYQAEYKDPIFRTADSLVYKVVDPNGNKQTGFYDVQGTLRAGQRCSTAKAYLVPAENRTNLDILPNAMVRKVVIEKRRAVGVEFDFQGKTYVVKALKEVIMSAGAINTPQLLMLSGIGPRKELQRLKIPVVANLPVGRNLQDHPATFLNFLLTSDVPGVTEKLTDPTNIMQYIQNRTGPLASTDFISAQAFLNSREDSPEEDYPDYDIYFQEAQTEEVALQIGLRPEVFSQVYGPLEGQSFYLCVSSLLHPKSRGTVTLNSNDPYDPPVIDPNYLEDPDDAIAIVEGLKTCMRFGNHRIMREAGSTLSDIPFPGCERYAENEDRYFTCLARNMIVTSGHPVGTARMGNPKDTNTVVDPQLRVLNIKGLRVVDASVMPLIPSGSINLPTMMLAEKASDIIKSTIECPDENDDEWNQEESNWSEDTQHPPQPNADYYDDGQEWKEEKNTFWSNTQPYPTHPDQYETPLQIKNQNTWHKDINHWVDMPQKPVQVDHHIVPWNQEILPTVGKFPAGKIVMENNGNKNYPVSDDEEEEEQEEYSNDSPPPSYNGNKMSDQHQLSQGMSNRPQMGHTPPPSNTQTTRPPTPASPPQTPQNQPQMQMTTTPMPPKSPPTRAPTTAGNNRQMPGRGKNITIHIQKPQSQINMLTSQIKNKIQVILEQLLMPNSASNPMQSNNTQSNKPSNPMQPNMPSNPMQPSMPSNPTQSNMPPNAMQPNRPSNPMQPNPPSNPIQSNRPPNNPMPPGSGSNMRPPVDPNLIEQIQKLEQMSSCEKEFCNSLLNYIDCQQQSCQKRAQFALYMFNVLCPSFTNKSTMS